MTAIRRHDPAASRAAILDAAERLFLDRGFAGTSMSEIAKASGVTKSLIHHHFGSKEALWEEVKRTRFSTYYDEQMKLLTQPEPGPEIVRESMRVYYQFLRDNPKVLRMMWWMLLEQDTERNELISELRETGVRQIRALQDAGVVRSDVRPEFILMTFLGVIHAGFTEDWVCKDAGLTVDAYMEDAWKLFSTGVAPAVA